MTARAAAAAKKRAIDFHMVNALALDHENLARVLAALGFTQRLWSAPRGALEWWPPSYLRLPDRAALRSRYPDAQVDAFLANRRCDLAPVNRTLRDADVLAMYRADPPVAIFVDSIDGEWRNLTNAVRGEDLVSLASYMWGVGLAYAAHRLARACGFAEAPVAHG